MNKQTLLTFPCNFSLKIVGENREGFVLQITSLISLHSNTFNPKQDLAIKLSRNQNYCSITAILTLQSQQQLDTIYQEIKKHPWVQFIL